MMTSRHLLRLQSLGRPLFLCPMRFRHGISVIPNVTAELKQDLRQNSLSRSRNNFIQKNGFCSDARKSSEVQVTSDSSSTTNETDSHGKKHQLGEVVVAKLFLSFTCTVCDGSNSYTISKQAYQSGVVIVTCLSCRNNHLIADNLGWFEDVKHKNIEEIMEAKGEKVRKLLSSDVKEFTIDTDVVDTKS